MLNRLKQTTLKTPPDVPLADFWLAAIDGMRAYKAFYNKLQKAIDDNDGDAYKVAVMESDKCPGAFITNHVVNDNADAVKKILDWTGDPARLSSRVAEVAVRNQKPAVLNMLLDEPFGQDFILKALFWASLNDESFLMDNAMVDPVKLVQYKIVTDILSARGVDAKAQSNVVFAEAKKDWDDFCNKLPSKRDVVKRNGLSL